MYAFAESKTNVCARPQQRRFYTFLSTPTYHLLAIERAARRRGYVAIWVERFMDVFLARADALCPGSEVPLERFARSTGLRVHPVPQKEI